MKKRHLKIKWKVSSFWEPFFATLIICFVCIIPYMRTLNSFNTIELYQHVYARSSLMLILIGVWPLAKRCDAMKTTIFSGNYCILQKALISGTVAVLCGEACVIAGFFTLCICIFQLLDYFLYTKARSESATNQQRYLTSFHKRISILALLFN